MAGGHLQVGEEPGSEELGVGHGPDPDHGSAGVGDQAPDEWCGAPDQFPKLGGRDRCDRGLVADRDPGLGVGVLEGPEADHRQRVASRDPPPSWPSRRTIVCLVHPDSRALEQSRSLARVDGHAAQRFERCTQAVDRASTQVGTVPRAALDHGFAQIGVPQLGAFE